MKAWTSGTLALSMLLLGGSALAQEGEQTSAAFAVVPDSSRDLEERLIVRFGVGIDPAFGSVSDPRATGLELDAANLRSGTTIFNSNLAFGTRRMFVPTLNTYSLTTFQTDIGGQPAIVAPETLGGEEAAAYPDVLHAFSDSRALLFHLAYAELDGFSTHGELKNFHLRAGRQFHFGVAPATFDGATVGYDSHAWTFEARAGRRAGNYDRHELDPARSETNPGFLAGGTVGYHRDTGDFGYSFEAEYLFFTRTLGLMERDRNLEFVDGASSVTIDGHLIDLIARVQPTEHLELSARAELFAPSLSDVRLGALLELGRTELMVDFRQKIGAGLYYGLSAGDGAELGDPELPITYESLRLNIPDEQPFSDLKATLLFDVAEWLELGPNLGGRIVYADLEERSPYDANRFSFGLLAQGRFRISERAGLELIGEYQGLVYSRSADEGDGAFRDLAMGGESLVHDVYAAVRYVRGTRATAGRMLTGQNLSTGLYGYLTSAKLTSRFLDEDLGETTGGVGIDGRYDFADYAGVRVAYEFAKDSSVFYNELGGFHVLRTSLEGRF